MRPVYIIGVDPGPMPGIVGMLVAPSKGFVTGPLDVVQCSADTVYRVLDGLTRGLVAPAVLAVERFVVGPRAGRSRTPSGGVSARFVHAITTEWARENGHALHERSAAEVKPWASDGRLIAAGLLDPCHGMPHARDAARHALFCAVKDYGLPDPFSKRPQGFCVPACRNRIDCPCPDAPGRSG